MNVRKGFARLARVTALAYWAVAIIILSVMAFDAFQDEGAGRRVFRVDFSAAGETLRACGRRFEADGAPIPCDRSVQRAGLTFTFPFDATDSEIDRALRFAVALERERRETLFQPQTTDNLRALVLARARARLEAAREAAAAGQRLFLAGFDAGGDWTEFNVTSIDPQQRHSNPEVARQVPHIYVWAEDGRRALNAARTFCSGPNVSCGDLRGGQVAVGVAERGVYALNQIGLPALIWLAVYLALWAIFRATRYVALGFMEKNATVPTPNNGGPL
jgi:hypothetical protein